MKITSKFIVSGVVAAAVGLTGFACPAVHAAQSEPGGLIAPFQSEPGGLSIEADPSQSEPGGLATPFQSEPGGL